MKQEVAEVSPSDVVVREPQAVTESAAMMSVIERAAMNPEVDVSKMERLYEMKEKIDAKAAEAAFNVAMNKAQSEMGRISADCTNTQTSSNYASYAQLDKALRPIYTRNGFSLSFDTGEVMVEGTGEAQERILPVYCFVSHEAGHTRKYHVDMDAGGKGAKGGAVMTKTHAAGAAMSYGMRYLLKMIFNVAIGEDDNDGNTYETISTEDAFRLDTEARAVGVDVPKFLKYFNVPSFDAIPIEQMENAEKAIDAKRKKNKSKDKK